MKYHKVEQCDVDRSNDHIGYITNLKSAKYATRLFRQWHDPEVKGIQCQLELINIYSTFDTTVDFTLPPIDSPLHRDRISTSSRDSSLSKNGHDFNTIRRRDSSLESTISSSNSKRK